MQIIQKEQLEQWISQKTDMLIIDLLPKQDFDKRNIPGSINIPFKNNDNFITELEKGLSSKDGKIVVYCANKKCDLSKQAAQKIDNAGFANVYDFEDGIEDWFKTDQNAAT